MTRRRMTQLAGATALAVVFAGCQDPYQHQQAPDAVRPAAPARGGADRPGPRPPARARMPGAEAGSAGAAVRAFAAAWVNWDWRTLAAHQRALAGLAVGQLAEQLRANARTS